MQSDLDLARALAMDAGQLLLRVRERHGLAGAALGRAGDLEANDLIIASLRAARPADAILSEESADSPARLDAPRVWIIDPLDGTREFIAPGRTDWAVHIALWERDVGLGACAVGMPATGESFFTSSSTRSTTMTTRARIIVSQSRPPKFIDDLCAHMNATKVVLGSAGAKAMAVVRGDVDAYVHAGGQWEWDSAAPVGVAMSAGLWCSRLDGSPLLYNQPHPYLPDLVICRPELSNDLLRALAAVL